MISQHGAGSLDLIDKPDQARHRSHFRFQIQILSHKHTNTSQIRSDQINEKCEGNKELFVSILQIQISFQMHAQRNVHPKRWGLRKERKGKTNNETQQHNIDKMEYRDGWTKKPNGNKTVLCFFAGGDGQNGHFTCSVCRSLKTS